MELPMYHLPLKQPLEGQIFNGAMALWSPNDHKSQLSYLEFLDPKGLGLFSKKYYSPSLYRCYLDPFKFQEFSMMTDHPDLSSLP